MAWAESSLPLVTQANGTPWYKNGYENSFRLVQNSFAISLKREPHHLVQCLVSLTFYWSFTELLLFSLHKHLQIFCLNLYWVSLVVFNVSSRLRFYEGFWTTEHSNLRIINNIILFSTILTLTFDQYNRFFGFPFLGVRCRENVK